MTRIKISIAFLLALYAAAAAAPLLSTHDPFQTEVTAQQRLLAPSRAHWLGTDELGRDVYSRMVYGGRVSLTVGLLAVVVALVIGVTVGALAGYFGGWVDACLMRLVEILICFPVFFLILMVIAFLGPSIIHVVLIIGATSWMGLARLVRAEILSLKERPFVLAERALGADWARILFLHLLPNASAPILVAATLGVAGAILTESALSFLGLGVQIPTPSWGNILSQGRYFIDRAWWLTFFPGMMIFATVFAWNVLGEALRDRWDPRHE